MSSELLLLLLFSAPTLAQDLLDTYENIHRVQALNTFWLEQSQWRIFLTRKITKLVITEFTEKSSLVHISATCHVSDYWLNSIFIF